MVDLVKTDGGFLIKEEFAKEICGHMDDAGIHQPAPLPATTVPIADNQNDTTLRTGAVGASLSYMREDSIRPIRRQSNPGTPIPVLSGPATETLSQLRRFRSDEESVTFTWRMRFVTTTANGWVIYTVPSLAGFQPPLVTCKGVYMQTGDQDDTGKQVATMAENGSVWADIGRVYYGQFSGKETAETWWPNIEAHYVRS